MKVLSVDELGRMGKVSYCGNELNVNIRLVTPHVGDYVLVHAGCAIEILQKEAAEEILEIFDSLQEQSFQDTAPQNSAPQDSDHA
ncbi:MAG: HypC/HybG/HupF family hydrogenase formation chaperone [Treponema sp.]|nr:HypC/HybG/HupF family hydrogenase formation chaperone [Treponema sp.]